jgi:hypothetical protein
VWAKDYDNLLRSAKRHKDILRLTCIWVLMSPILSSVKIQHSCILFLPYIEPVIKIFSLLLFRKTLLSWIISNTTFCHNFPWRTLYKCNANELTRAPKQPALFAWHTITKPPQSASNCMGDNKTIMFASIHTLAKNTHFRDKGHNKTTAL